MSNKVRESWNVKREREREIESIVTAKPMGAYLPILLSRTHGHNISLKTFFFKEKWNYRLFLCNGLNELQFWIIRDFYFYFLFLNRLFVV